MSECVCERERERERERESIYIQKLYQVPVAYTYVISCCKYKRYLIKRFIFERNETGM